MNSNLQTLFKRCRVTNLALVRPMLTLGVENFCQPKNSRSFSAGSGKVKTGVVMLNMGGPSTPEETGPFLKNLFNDEDIIDLGGGKAQQLLGDFVSWRRTPKVQEQYEQIGGSPIKKWTEYQGVEMCKKLDKICPESAPHKAYTAFRYANPQTNEALEEMKKDGVEHAIAFSQFPQWSCTTSGSSMNELGRELKRLNMVDEFKWSAIDRWNLHQGYIDALLGRIEEKLSEYDEKEREKFVFIFSAHSVPMKVVEKGDHYITEVAATVQKVMKDWSEKVESGQVKGVKSVNKSVMAWQSKVGFLPWMVPNTESAIKNLGKKGNRHVLVIPVAFTSDHIETLFEIGMEYAEDAEKAGIENFAFTEGLNGSEIFIDALADLVQTHLEKKENYSSQYKMKCLTCIKPHCRQLANPKY